MSQFEDARFCGMIDIPRNANCCFRVFTDNSNCVVVQTAAQPIDARWSGGSILVEMSNGQMRRYFGLSESQYELIYR
jgi:hypothetical protein